MNADTYYDTCMRIEGWSLTNLYQRRLHLVTKYDYLKNGNYLILISAYEMLGLYETIIILSGWG